MSNKTTNSNPLVQDLAGTVGRNTILGVVSSFAQVGTRFVTVPIVILHLGLGGYGIWNIIMTTATYMRFGSVGIKTAFQKYVAEATGNGDYETASKLLSTGCAAMLVLSMAGLVPIAVFSYRIAHFAGIPPEFLKSGAGAITLLAVIMMMSNTGAAFEAIVMGGHRIDLVRKYSTVLTIAEAIAIIVVLRLGYGLLAMAATMGASELLYISGCFLASRRILPQVEVSRKFVSKDVLYELVRFAGSYQLVNIFEVLYAAIIPFAILRVFGARSAGVYAVVGRVAGSATLLLGAFLPPILSAGTMIYASASFQGMQRLFIKAFKVTTALTLFPMGFIALFGTDMVYAWTGQTDAYFQEAFWVICLTGIFSSLSLLSLVLYRVSGKAILDNIRQVVRILIILVVSLFAAKLGFVGVLAGLGLAEFTGLVLMLFALDGTFPEFSIKALIPDAVKSIAVMIVILGGGLAAYHIPIPLDLTSRVYSIVKLLEAGLGCLIMAWPALLWTNYTTTVERKAIINTLLFRRSSPAEVIVQGAGE